jgi:hypothetical protein
MQRREFLVGVTASSIGTIAGCAGITSPDIEQIRTVHPDPYAVSVDTEGTEYFGTIHNRGYGGNVRLELWFFQDQSVPTPDESHLFNTSDRNDRVFDVARNSLVKTSGEKTRSMQLSNNQNGIKGNSQFFQFLLLTEVNLRILEVLGRWK